MISKEAMAAVSALCAKEGSDAWYSKTAKEILPAGTKCPKCGCSEFTQEHDIMDVWFDSGCSHAAVADQRPELGKRWEEYKSLPAREKTKLRAPDPSPVERDRFQPLPREWVLPPYLRPQRAAQPRKAD